MTGIWQFLSGKKTYLVAAVGLLYGYLTGNQDLMFQSIIGATIRNGIGK